MRGSLEDDLLSLEDALRELKLEIAKHWKMVIIGIALVWSFLGGAAIEHYYPELISRLWY